MNGRTVSGNAVPALCLFRAPNHSAPADDTAFDATLVVGPHDDAPGGVRVGSDAWIFPKTKGNFARPNTRTIRHDIDLPDGTDLSHPRHRALMLARKAYFFAILSTPYNGRVLDISTVQGHSRIINGWTRWFVAEAYGLGFRSFADLPPAMVEKLISTYRKQAPGSGKQIDSVLLRVREHGARGHLRGLWFDPVDHGVSGELQVDAVLPDDAPVAHHQQKPFQPLPDAFVAQAGRIWLFYAERLAQHLIRIAAERNEIARLVEKECMDAAEGTREAYRKFRFKEYLESYQWPDDLRTLPFEHDYAFPPRNQRHMQVLLTMLQASVAQMVSLLVGPRMSEMVSMTRKVLKTVKNQDGSVDNLIVGRTMKLDERYRGAERDWPIPPAAATAIQRQIELSETLAGPEATHLWAAVQVDGNPPMADLSYLFDTFAKKHRLGHLLGDAGNHHHRYRKTIARLVVLTLVGGPKLLQELLGHRSIMMTLRYILASPFIRQEMLAIAEEERRLVVQEVVAGADSSGGPGARALKEDIGRIIENLDITVPKTERSQRRWTVEEIVETFMVGPEEGGMKMILPGVFCVKPTGEAGACCRSGEMPNLTLCETACRWHLNQENRRPSIRLNVAFHIDRLLDTEVARNEFLTETHRRGLLSELSVFEDIAAEYNDHPLVVAAREAFRKFEDAAA